MEHSMNRSLIRHGFVLILLALVGAFFIPAMALPRLGLSAHTVGVLGGVLLIAVGAVWALFALAPRVRKLLAVSWVAAGYLNWAGCLLGASLGAGRATPISAGGAVGPAWAELLSGGLLLGAAAASLLAVVLSIRGLHGRPRPDN
jgi:hydroxylaminobenzene mutase